VSVATRTRYVENTEWLSPTNIDSSGVVNVSAALTDWIAAPHHEDLNVFKLRTGFYWIPQGIRIGRPCRFDLNGSWLFTSTQLGDTDTDLAANTILYPPLWDDWDESDTWPLKRCNINVQATNVHIYNSSTSTARIIGGSRLVFFRGTGAGFADASAGIVFDSDFEGQHGIRLGGGTSSTPKVTDVTIDLTNTSIELVGGDGIYLNDQTARVTILGRSHGEAFMGGYVSDHDDGDLEGYTGQGATINGTPTDPPTATWGVDLFTPYAGIHHTGRQGIATDFRVDDVLIDGVAIWRVGRAIFDLEPTSAGAQCTNWTIRNCETGIHPLNWIAAAGLRKIDNLTVENNVCYERIKIDNFNTSATQRCTNWVLTNNRCLTGVKHRSGALFRVGRIDGLTITDNRGLIRPTGEGIDSNGDGSGGANGASTSVTVTPVEDVQFPNGAAHYGPPSTAAGVANQATVSTA
jgi:hypothetical protein